MNKKKTEQYRALKFLLPTMKSGSDYSTALKVSLEIRSKVIRPRI